MLHSTSFLTFSVDQLYSSLIRIRLRSRESIMCISDSHEAASCGYLGIAKSICSEAVIMYSIKIMVSHCPSSHSANQDVSTAYLASLCTVCQDILAQTPKSQYALVLSPLRRCHAQNTKTKVIKACSSSPIGIPSSRILPRTISETTLLCHVAVRSGVLHTLQVVSRDQLFDTLLDHWHVWLELVRQDLNDLRDELRVAELLPLPVRRTS